MSTWNGDIYLTTFSDTNAVEAVSVNIYWLKQHNMNRTQRTQINQFKMDENL